MWIAAAFGYFSYKTIQDGGGLMSNMHRYYSLTRGEYAAIVTVVFICAVSLIVSNGWVLQKRKNHLLNRQLVYFVLFLALLAGVEYFLEGRFHGKG